jgi:hypothetical protein
VEVAEEVDAGAVHALLDKLTLLLGLPKRCHEWSFGVGSVVFPHHFTNRYRSLSGVVEGYCTYEVMADVSPNNVVEQVFINETKISIDGCSCASHECPCAVSVMRQRAIRVMKESDGN